MMLSDGISPQLAIKHLLAHNKLNAVRCQQIEALSAEFIPQEKPGSQA